MSYFKKISYAFSAFEVILYAIFISCLDHSHPADSTFTILPQKQIGYGYVLNIFYVTLFFLFVGGNVKCLCIDARDDVHDVHDATSAVSNVDVRLVAMSA